MEHKSELQRDSKRSALQAKEPYRLDNGKWSCAHKCKDKTS